MVNLLFSPLKRMQKNPKKQTELSLLLSFCASADFWSWVVPLVNPVTLKMVKLHPFSKRKMQGEWETVFSSFRVYSGVLSQCKVQPRGRIAAIERVEGL